MSRNHSEVVKYRSGQFLAASYQLKQKTSLIRLVFYYIALSNPFSNLGNYLFTISLLSEIIG
ncbi:hypothetical protein ATS76_05715 [Pseudoalteromonas sp. 10-33]|nr:hypothetical protein ATS76_05715 [Pseudoalteromonas sp. 10-33]